MVVSFDLLLKGGTVIDPAQQINGTRDLAFVDGKVARIAADISAGHAREVYDAAGKIVAPGLVDTHAHFYYGVTQLNRDPRTDFIPTGVTCAADAGTAGAANYANLRDLLIKPGVLHLYAWLNLRVIGDLGKGFHDGFTWRAFVDADPLEQANVESAVRLIKQNSDSIVGVKVILRRKGGAELATELLARAIDAANQTGTKVMCHIEGFPEGFTWRALVDRMLRGDMITHAFHSDEPNILDGNGKIRSEVVEARAKGILLDTGTATQHHWSWAIAEAAADQGIWPDTISTDDHVPKQGDPRYTMPDLMSEYLALGMPLDQIVAAATSRSAAALGKAGVHGSLRVGACGDAAVLETREGDFDYSSMRGGSKTVKRRLIPVLTVKSGKVAWRAA